MAYLDTSILGSYYCVEKTSAAVNRELRGLGEAYISPIVEVEFVSLLSLKVRNSVLDRPSATAANKAFRRHLADHLYKIRELEEVDFMAAGRWLGRFDTPLRTMDSLHLAIAWNLKQPLWTTDKALAQAARLLKVPHHLVT